MLNRFYNKQNLSERGAIMIFFAMLLPVLFGFVGFGFDALTKSDYKGAGWSGSAQGLAEQKLAEYSSTLSALVSDEEIKSKARNKVDNYRYICNKAVRDDLVSRGITV